MNELGTNMFCLVLTLAQSDHLPLPSSSPSSSSFSLSPSPSSFRLGDTVVPVMSSSYHILQFNLFCRLLIDQKSYFPLLHYHISLINYNFINMVPLIYPFLGLIIGNLIIISHGHPCGPEENESTIDAFLEQPLFSSVKVWHLVMIGILVAIIATIVLCCIMRCRIPRTKQEIEADAIRKKVTKQFRAHLNKIPIEGMELIKVLNEVKDYEEERIRKGTIEEKKTLMQKLKAIFKSEKQDSLDRSGVKEDDEAGSVDGEGRKEEDDNEKKGMEEITTVTVTEIEQTTSPSTSKEKY